MACTCLSSVNELLHQRNTRLASTIIFADPCYETVTVMTQQIARGRGKAKACAMLPTFCPFCGIRYQEAPSVADEAESVAA